MIKHDPRRDYRGEQEEARYERAKFVYYKLFRKAPPVDLWPPFDEMFFQACNRD
jgi:hypothetical protein